jgi:hypothetical protein
MSTSSSSRTSRWGAPSFLAGIALATTLSACFDLGEDAYLHDAGASATGTGGMNGTGGASSTGSGGGSATAGTNTTVGAGGNVGTGGNVGAGGAVANGGGGNTANTGGGGSGGANAGGGGAGQGGAGGQGGAMTTCPAQKPPDGTGTGLKGEYFNTQDLSGTVALTRIDPKVDFDWGTGSPDPAVTVVDHFSARWTGQIQPRYSGKYTFSTISDDGSRVTIDGKVVVDAFVDQGGNVENTGYADLSAGQKYSIKVEYYENTGGALIHFSWESMCQTKEIVPTSQLYPQ